MVIKPLVILLTDTIGLNPDSIGLANIEHSVQKRMQIVVAKDQHQYYQMLKNNEEEITNLINEVTVGETWFFRERNAFDLLRVHVREFFKNGSGTKVRIASMPCSSGEEPYSIAIELLEEGLKPSQFVIDGYDINAQSLMMARDGIYTDFSFRGVECKHFDRYFDKGYSGFKVNKKVKDAVRFRQENLLFLKKENINFTYDIVFCRNLMIYLEEDSRKQLARVLESSLTANGLLVVGHSEAPSFCQLGFSTLNDKHLYAFKKVIPKDVTSRTRNDSISPSSGYCKQSTNKRVPAASENVVEKSNVERKILKEKIISIEALANSGQLNEAEDACKKLLKSAPDNIDASYVMGLLKEAKGDWVEAGNYFRRVLYLQPNHQDALLHSSAIYERQGQLDKAKQFRERLGRLMK